MRQGQRGHFWVVFQAVVLSALFAFVVPQPADAHVDIGLDTHSGATEQQGTPVSDDTFDMFKHCHPGLDCSVQVVFFTGYLTRFEVVDLRLVFQFATKNLPGRPVAFDPPPPRVLS